MWRYADAGSIPGMDFTANRFLTQLPLNETFAAPQGEGPYLGRRASFVRLGICNLSCTGCDTAKTWDREKYDLAYENPLTPVPEILEQVRAHRTRLTIVTGGEPLIWQQTSAFRDLVVGLTESGRKIHFETNGTIAPTLATVSFSEHFTVSPKIGPLASPRDPERKRIRHDVLGEFAGLAAAGQACFKFVCSTVENVTAVALFCARHGLDAATVWIMPYGSTAAEVAAVQPVITPAAMDSGFNTTTRLHLIADTR